MQLVDGKEYNANQLMGLPEHVSMTRYLAYWGNQLEGAAREAYFRFFNVEFLMDQFRKGERELSYTYWTTTVTGKSMLAEQREFTSALSEIYHAIFILTWNRMRMK